MKQIIKSIIYDSIDELNELLLDKNNQIKKDDNEIIFGEETNLDSLTTVNFIVILEQNIQSELNDFEISMIDLVKENEVLTVFDLANLISSIIQPD